MSDLADLNHYWSGDLMQGPTGDIATSTGFNRSAQRVIRRLLTNPGGGDYPWEPNYGAGLPAKIGTNLDIGGLTTLIIGQIALEPTIARTPQPQVTITQIQGGAAIQIVAYDLNGTGVPINFSLTTSPQVSAPFPIPVLESPTPPSPHQLPPVQGTQAFVRQSSPIPAATGF